MDPSFGPEVTFLNPEMHLHLPSCFGSFIDQYLCPVLDYLFTSTIGKKKKKKDRRADSISQSVQLLSRVQLFGIPWTAASQASLSITNSRSLLKLMSIECVMASNHLILCCPLLLLPSVFPASGSFQMTQLFTSGGQSIGVSASTSVLPMNIQD